MLTTVAFALSVSLLPDLDLGGAPPVGVLVPGSFHGADLRDVEGAADGATWMALVRRGDGYALESARLRLEREPDPALDGPGEATGLRVSTASGPLPLFLMRGVDLRPGPVETALDREGFLPPGAAVRWVGLDGRSTELRALGAASEDPVWGTVFDDYRLRLGDGTGTVDLFSAQRLDVALPSVLWAGDLNGDGALDVVMETSLDSGAVQIELFLSDDGALARPVALLLGTGC